MGLYRTLHVSFWEDLLSHGVDEKYFYFYLLTNPHTNISGIYKIPMPYIILETGLSEKKIVAMFAYWAHHDKIRWNRDTEEVGIKNWTRYNVSKGSKVLTAVQRFVDGIKDKTLIKYVWNDVFRYPIDGVSEVENTISEVEDTPTVPVTDTVSDSESCSGTRKTVDVPKPEYVELAEKLIDGITENDPQAFNGKREATVTAWADVFRLMVEKDERPPPEIRNVIRFATHDDFWKANILSAKKFREKYTTLKLQSRRGNKKSSDDPAYENIFES